MYNLTVLFDVLYPRVTPSKTTTKKYNKMSIKLKKYEHTDLQIHSQAFREHPDNSHHSGNTAGHRNSPQWYRLLHGVDSSQETVQHQDSFLKKTI